MDVAARIAEHVGGGPGVRHLGSGETYDAWAVDTGGETVVYRVVRRPVDELPRPMAEEFAALLLVPADVGPRGLRLELDPAVLGVPFMVETLVPGAVLPSSSWTPALFAAHAQQLAALHAVRSDRCGPVTSPASSSLSMVETFAASLDWWTGHHPEITADPEVRALLALAEPFVRDAEPAFRRLDAFALIHGDAVLTNILVDDAGRPRYVDWEWSEYGDPARDLAYACGPVAADPWYAAVTPADLDAFTAGYATAAGVGALPDLRIRRDAWELHERLFTSLHFRRPGPATRHPHAAGALTDGLRTWLGTL